MLLNQPADRIASRAPALLALEHNHVELAEWIAEGDGALAALASQRDLSGPPADRAAGRDGKMADWSVSSRPQRHGAGAEQP